MMVRAEWTLYGDDACLKVTNREPVVYEALCGWDPGKREADWTASERIIDVGDDIE